MAETLAADGTAELAATLEVVVDVAQPAVAAAAAVVAAGVEAAAAEVVAAADAVAADAEANYSGTRAQLRDNGSY